MKYTLLPGRFGGPSCAKWSEMTRSIWPTWKGTISRRPKIAAAPANETSLEFACARSVIAHPASIGITPQAEWKYRYPQPWAWSNLTNTYTTNVRLADQANRRMRRSVRWREYPRSATTNRHGVAHTHIFTKAATRLFSRVAFGQAKTPEATPCIAASWPPDPISDLSISHASAIATPGR